MTQELDYIEASESNEDFTELEALINPKPTPDAQDDDEGFDELEALLEDQGRIRAWELAKEWLPVANTALFKRYACVCGFHTTVFEGLMLEQRHRHSSHANRWTVQEAALASLPNKTAIRTAQIPMCQRCAASKGYSLVTDLEWQV